MKKIFLVVFVSAIISCGHHDKKTTDPAPSPDSPPIKNDTLHKMEAHLDSNLLFSTSTAILTAIKAKDHKALAGFIHPEQGLLFSPFKYIDSSCLVIKANEFESLANSNKKLNWHSSWMEEDADSLLTVKDYFKRFVYDVDFIKAPERTFNESHNAGTEINNTFEIFKGSDFVEFFFPGFEKKYDGLDFRGLQLVFKAYNGKPYLVGIVHDEWTP